MQSGGQFGLNSGTITKFEYNPNAGADKSPSDAIEITFKIDEKDFRSRIYDVSGPLKGKEPDEDGYPELKIKEVRNRLAKITHILKGLGITEEEIGKQIKGCTSFGEFARKIPDLFKEEHTKVLLDVFLEYQYKIRDNQSKTFLEIPRNYWNRKFVCKHIEPVGEWKEVRDRDGLKYVDDKKNEHVFTRNSNYMNGNNANEQSRDVIKIEPEITPSSNERWN